MKATRPARFAIATLLLLAVAPAQSNRQPSPSDSYAVYSVLLSPAETRQLPAGRQLAIDGTTVTIDDMASAAEPENELDPSLSRVQGFQQALRDFQAHREDRVQLQHQFNLNRSYALLTDQEVAGLRASLSSGGSSDAQGAGKWTQYSALVRFSRVYFNGAHTAALVYKDTECPQPCGSGHWIYLEKRAGRWVRRDSSTVDSSDTYAIYSLLMPGVPFQGMSTDQAPHFAIAATTIDIDDMNPAIPPDGQLQPPAQNPQAFSEAVEDFHVREHESMQLEPRLKLDRPYTLLSSGDVAELRQSLTGIDPGSQLKDKYAGYPGVTYFSEVYFNADRTAALVYMNTFCATLCANGQWIYLEKRGGAWVRRSGLNV